MPQANLPAPEIPVTACDISGTAVSLPSTITSVVESSPHLSSNEHGPKECSRIDEGRTLSSLPEVSAVSQSAAVSLDVSGTTVPAAISSSPPASPVNSVAEPEGFAAALQVLNAATAAVPVGPFPSGAGQVRESDAGLSSPSVQAPLISAQQNVLDIQPHATPAIRQDVPMNASSSTETANVAPAVSATEARMGSTEGVFMA
jgi:hypothetical protein